MIQLSTNQELHIDHVLICVGLEGVTAGACITSAVSGTDLEVTGVDFQALYTRQKSQQLFPLHLRVFEKFGILMVNASIPDVAATELGHAIISWLLALDVKQISIACSVHVPPSAHDLSLVSLYGSVQLDKFPRVPNGCAISNPLLAALIHYTRILQIPYSCFVISHSTTKVICYVY